MAIRSPWCNLNRQIAPLIRHGLRRATFSRWEKVRTANGRPYGGNGLPRQCAHWLAMTAKYESSCKNETEQGKAVTNTTALAHALSAATGRKNTPRSGCSGGRFTMWAMEFCRCSQTGH